MKKNIDFSFLPTNIEGENYCNPYVELALNTHYKESYKILESIYYLGRWYASRKSLKMYFNIGDSTLKRRLDILEKCCLIEYFQMNTTNSYVKLTNEGASLVLKRITKLNAKTEDTYKLVQKSDIIYTLASKSFSNKELLSKNPNRDKMLRDIYNLSIIRETTSINTLEQNHIYVVNAKENEITLATRHINVIDFFKDGVKIYEFVSKYNLLDEIKINILLLTKEEEKALRTLSDIQEDDFKKSERKELLSYLYNKPLGISYEDFLQCLYNATKIITY